MEKPTLVTKGGVGYGVDETQKVVEFWPKMHKLPKKQSNLGAEKKVHGGSCQTPIPSMYGIFTYIYIVDF